jgi:uncharacterized protein YicC (UPF0701 family)
VPILAIQKLLGHKDIDTTLVYSRVYDSTVAADYYRAMGKIEGMSDQPGNGQDLLALLDVLQSDELNETQQETVRALRNAIRALDLDRIPNGKENGSVIAEQFDRASSLG